MRLSDPPGYVETAWSCGSQVPRMPESAAGEAVSATSQPDPARPGSQAAAMLPLELVVDRPDLSPNVRYLCVACRLVAG